MSTAIDEMTCREFVELVTDLIEGELAEAKRVEAEAHLGECDGCATYLEQIQQTIAGLRRLADVRRLTPDPRAGARGVPRAQAHELGAAPAGAAPELVRRPRRYFSFSLLKTPAWSES